MKTIFHPASERGHVNFGWLDSHHSFSFGNWHHPEKVHFGALRVLNDDIVKGGGGFDTHPHDNMEIVSIPLKGAIAHKDSTGTEGIVYSGDVQIMSAGTGIRHSEYNGSASEFAKLLQIWVFPKLRNIKPAYGQKNYDVKDRKNKWQVVVSPDAREQALNINQDARFALTDLDAGQSISYQMKWKNSGLYLFVIEGAVKTENQSLAKRDALGISDTDQVNIEAVTDTQLLVIEVPLLG